MPELGDFLTDLLPFHLLDSENTRHNRMLAVFAIQEDLSLKDNCRCPGGGLQIWRTYGGQEIDDVKERDGGLFGFECQWSSKRWDKPPKKWRGAYPEAAFLLVMLDNYHLTY